ncbi:MAG: shikimate dehydrogenase [Lachnospiraceae bacterium]|nr:shikimate dehydrogenase [Lachnospiraceae bacterium]
MSKNYRSELVGAFGCPIDENPTGVMEEAAFAAAGLDYRYLTIKVEKDDIETAMKAVRAFHMRGINLTIPHKVSVIPYVDELSPEAQIIGAINIVVNNDGILWGDNTDGKGFLKSLTDKGISVEQKTIAILGAGGAARAISVVCALEGAAKIHIINGSVARGGELVDLLKEKTPADAALIPWEGTVDIPGGTDILINATSVGLYPNVDQKPDINYDSIGSGMVVCDVIFNDPNSLFLQEAAKRGADTVNGLGMLVNQGALNFKLWTGQDAPVDVMTEILRREFGV